jgi:hypothetical protein
LTGSRPEQKTHVAERASARSMIAGTAALLPLHHSLECILRTNDCEM